MDLQQQRCELDGSYLHWCDEKLAGYYLLGKRDKTGSVSVEWQHMDLEQQWCDLDGTYLC
jgi:hypothetical protein